jgi:hypothetical protein
LGGGSDELTEIFWRGSVCFATRHALLRERRYAPRGQRNRGPCKKNYQAGEKEDQHVAAGEAPISIDREEHRYHPQQQSCDNAARGSTFEQ